MGTIDIRNINAEYFNPWKNYTVAELEWFKQPTQFRHFKARIDLLYKEQAGDPYYNGERDFYDFLKLKILNLVPTRNKELTENVYKYLNDKYGSKELELIIRKCARYRIKRENNE